MNLSDLGIKEQEVGEEFLRIYPSGGSSNWGYNLSYIKDELEGFDPDADPDDQPNFSKAICSIEFGAESKEYINEKGHCFETLEELVADMVDVDVESICYKVYGKRKVQDDRETSLHVYNMDSFILFIIDKPYKVHYEHIGGRAMTELEKTLIDRFIILAENTATVLKIIKD